MARKVKCIDTGEYSTNDVAYKAHNGKYYSTEEAFKKMEYEQSMRTKCIDLMMNILNVDILSTQFFKKLKELNIYGYEVLLRTIELNRTSIEWALENRRFDNEYTKINYIMAIVQNNLNDTKKLIDREHKQQQNVSEYVPESFNIDISTENKPKINKKDVSSLLGDI